MITWAVRACFAIVFAWNVLCALQFAIAPAEYVGAYQLSGAGAAGEAAIRGLGIAFLMWNATYPAFIWRPSKYRVLGFVIIVQQVIGLVGELFVFSGLAGNAAFATLASSIMRFVLFDLAGLVIMAVSFAVFMHARPKREGKEPICTN